VHKVIFKHRLAITALSLWALALPVTARDIVFSPVPAGPNEILNSNALVVVISSNDDLKSIKSLNAGEAQAIDLALKAAEFKYERAQTQTLYGIGRYSRLVVISTGTSQLTHLQWQEIGGIAARETKSHKGPVFFSTAKPDDPKALSHVGLGQKLGNYSFDIYRSKTDTAKDQDAPFTIFTDNVSKANNEFINLNKPLAESVNFSRDLVSEPANILYPKSFVDRAQAEFKGLPNVKITILDDNKLKALGFGGTVSVGKGSERPPYVMIIEYKGSRAPDRPIALIGKGITFDSGGISIKPSLNMWRMKMDMSGAAAVTGTILAHAKAKSPVNLIAIAGLAENMPSGGAARPGDVIRSYNGKTIEITNTDAEGRLVLADAVAYAEVTYKPIAIIDVATLTGSIVGALGPDYAGLFSRNDNLAQSLIKSGEETGEKLWRMPLLDSYVTSLKSPIADIRDVADDGAPGAGIGAAFIGYFIKPETPWAHLDIAGTAWTSKPSPTDPAIAAGYGVRLLHHFTLNYKP
jgi:leucyl aminopeptidase